MYVFITGDLNARTASLADYAQLEFLAKESELDDETAQSFDKQLFKNN